MRPMQPDRIRRSRWQVLLAGAAAVTLALAACQNPNEPEEPTPDPGGPEFATTSGTKTIYVSPSGNDNNSGTSSSSPWRTLSKVSATKFYPGDRILLQGGATFSGKIFFNSGSKGTASS